MAIVKWLLTGAVLAALLFAGDYAVQRVKLYGYLGDLDSWLPQLGAAYEALEEASVYPRPTNANWRSVVERRSKHMQRLSSDLDTMRPWLPRQYFRGHQLLKSAMGLCATSAEAFLVYIDSRDPTDIAIAKQALRECDIGIGAAAVYFR